MLFVVVLHHGGLVCEHPGALGFCICIKAWYNFTCHAITLMLLDKELCGKNFFTFATRKAREIQLICMVVKVVLLECFSTRNFSTTYLTLGSFFPLEMPLEMPIKTGLPCEGLVAHMTLDQLPQMVPPIMILILITFRELSFAGWACVGPLFWKGKQVL